VFVFSDTHKNESQEYQFNGENSTARYGYAFILSYTSRMKAKNINLMVKIQLQDMHVQFCWHHS
ncbi:MAG: hypothetical protein KJ886_03785, partial [Candidatus Thermoplasmatota archaeon]|nr:hypothetical protein [Candidatus Thermoplasmatota archaeon]